MRILNLYLVFDENAKAIVGKVVHLNSPVPLIRELTDEANNPDSMIGKHPADYSVYLVGTLDEDTGQLTALDTPQKLTSALALKRPAQ